MAKTGPGEMIVKKLSPLKAIRENCLTCVGERGNVRYQMVEICTIRKCPLWPYRFGVRPETAKARGKDATP